MKNINIKYVDFWPNFDYHNDLLFQMLDKSEQFTPIISDAPDYIVYSTFGKEHLKYECIRIFFAGEEQSPDFNVCDYAIGFDYIEFGDRYFRLPLMYQPLYRDDFLKMVNRETNLKGKNNFCSFVYSNPEADPFRENFFDELSKYKQVDSGGRYRNNVGGPVLDKFEFESTHKFSIAFENVKHPGYTTEKIMQAFAAGTVPIYWGDPLVAEMFNAKAFINIVDYPDVNSAIERIKYLDTYDDEYLSVLEEPVLKAEWQLDVVEQKFKVFVENIFGQDLSSAQRTTRKFWNKKYVEMQRNQEKLYQMTSLIRGIRYKLLRVLGKK